MASDATTFPGRPEDTMPPPRSGLAGLGPPFKAVLRIGAGLLFMQHGAQKLFGLLGGFGGTPGNTAELFSQMGLAGVLEFFGGLLVVLGLFTRPVAVVLFLEMMVALFTVHLPRGGFPMQNGGEVPLLYGLIFLYFAASGPGPASIDSRLGSRSRS